MVVGLAGSFIPLQGFLLYIPGGAGFQSTGLFPTKRAFREEIVLPSRLFFGMINLKRPFLLKYQIMLRSGEVRWQLKNLHFQ